jgi:hypothetical protein
MPNRLFLIGLLVLASGGLNAQTQPTLSPSNAVLTNATPSNSSNAFDATNPVPAASSQTRNPSYDPLLDLPPLAHNKVSLIGGTVTNVDGVLNRITIRPFGSKQQMHLAFDSRSQIEQDGKPATQQDIRAGEHVYIDSMLDATRLFAKAIRIEAAGASGLGRGQILRYDAGSQVLSLRDELSDRAVRFRLSPATVIHIGNQIGSLADLRPGSLVSLDFASQQGHVVVQQISLLAETGANFVFFGRITFIDLARNLIAIENQSDAKTYEIYLTSIDPSTIRDLHEGREVSVSAVFDGMQYTARSLTPSPSPQSSDQ